MSAAGRGVAEGASGDDGSRRAPRATTPVAMRPPLRSSHSSDGGGGGGGAASARASESAAEDFGQGWTQLTDQGKIYLSKKEKNVFILEGTKAAGFSAGAYGGTAEQRAAVVSGYFTLTADVKTMPNELCPEQQVYILLDCFGMTDLSSGCDFCGVRLSFDSRELRVEGHRRNAAMQTLYAQPSCALLRSGTYTTVVVAVQGDTFSLSLSGVSIVSNLSMGRSVRSADSSPMVGLAVYGRSRCCLKRFRVAAAVSAAEEPAVRPALPLAPAGAASPPPAAHRGPSVARRGSAGPGGYGGDLEAPVLGRGACGSSYAVEEMELAATIERDIVCADLNVRFDDIGGLEDAKRAINEAMVLPLILPEFFTGLRTPWKGVLLFGPPGTGKTMLAKAVASCTDNITFFNCSSATLTSKWRGESEKLLRALFLTARARVPSILFFDEIDSLLGQRGSTAEHEASRRFKSEFLIHMDGLLSDARPDGDATAGHLLVLATSNAPWDLDEALRRRLEKRIYIPLPDCQARLRMIQHHLKAIHISEDIDFESLAERTEGYSGADVQMVCRDASMNPMRRLIAGRSPAELVQLRDEGSLSPGSVPVEMSDLEAALASVKPSVAIGDTVRYADWARDFGSR